MSVIVCFVLWCWGSSQRPCTYWVNAVPWSSVFNPVVFQCFENACDYLQYLLHHLCIGQDLVFTKHLKDKIRNLGEKGD